MKWCLQPHFVTEQKHLWDCKNHHSKISMWGKIRILLYVTWKQQNYGLSVILARNVHMLTYTNPVLCHKSTQRVKYEHFILFLFCECWHYFKVCIHHWMRIGICFLSTPYTKHMFIQMKSLTLSDSPNEELKSLYEPCGL